jgi:hypothetical protein
MYISIALTFTCTAELIEMEGAFATMLIEMRGEM